MKQLFANNAKTTLSTGISPIDTSLQVVDGSIFPSPGANEYFLVTLEIGSQIEILRVTTRTGNTFLLTSVADRAQEGTSALSFPAGTRVEVRVTKGTLDIYSKALLPLNSVALLTAPKDAYNTGYICANLDAYGNPAVLVTKDDYSWRFLNYTLVQSLTSTTSNTATSLNCTGLQISGTSLGKYLVQITSGTYRGYVREISSYTSTSISWASPLGAGPVDGTTFEILQSNASILIDTLSISDDAVVMPLILGGI